MMTLRKIKKEDIEELWRIHAKFYNFPFPDLTNPLYAIQDVVTDENGMIIMAGIARLTSEGIFITNKDAPSAARIKAIAIMNQEMERVLKSLGLEDCHVFAENDPTFLNYLKKLGFEDCTGIPLVRYEQKPAKDNIQ